MSEETYEERSKLARCGEKTDKNSPFSIANTWDYANSHAYLVEQFLSEESGYNDDDRRLIIMDNIRLIKSRMKLLKTKKERKEIMFALINLPFGIALMQFSHLGSSYLLTVYILEKVLEEELEEKCVDVGDDRCC